MEITQSLQRRQPVADAPSSLAPLHRPRTRNRSARLEGPPREERWSSRPVTSPARASTARVVSSTVTSWPSLVLPFPHGSGPWVCTRSRPAQQAHSMHLRRWAPGSLSLQGDALRIHVPVRFQTIPHRSLSVALGDYITPDRQARRFARSLLTRCSSPYSPVCQAVPGSSASRLSHGAITAKPLPPAYSSDSCAGPELQLALVTSGNSLCNVLKERSGFAGLQRCLLR